MEIKTEHFHPSPGDTEPLVVVVDHLPDEGPENIWHSGQIEDTLHS